MHRFLCVVVLLAIAAPAAAEKPPKDEADVAHHARVTWQQRFAAANAAHDGHLTCQEAKGGFPIVSRHFDDIDVEHKGYVTENDVRAWRIMQKAAHRLTKPQEDKLRPRAAFQRVHPDTKPINTSSRQTMATMSDRPTANN